MIPIYDYRTVKDDNIFSRIAPVRDISAPVAEILRDVRENGDEALRRLTEKFDGVKLGSLVVSEEEMAEAFAAVDPDFLRILETAAANIRRFHEQQVREGFQVTGPDGQIVGQRVLPIEKVGICVPGAEAAYPSSVLMDTIPAKIAGCSEIVMISPPDKQGKMNPAVLAAAKIAGVTRIIKAGGAQAVAALAYGTESVPAVDKIVGPGGAFVAEAKRQVFGKVAIDMIAGPSEILVISDGKSNPRNVAADMLSQAEHDRLACAVLVTDSAELAQKVQAEIETQLAALPREEIARTSVENNGKIIVAEDLESVVEISNRLAPEHLELCVEDPFAWLPKIKNAGSVFLGRWCPEAIGDYWAGANHTLPTGGGARFSSPLSVDDFVKKSQYIYYPEDALRKAAADVDRFARQERLEGHGRSVTIRLEGDSNE